MPGASTFPDTKPHYLLLDALRGVAALLVVCYHVLEGYSFAGGLRTGEFAPITPLNHGYLAVDFFFILSGFVIGYAYDDRWNGRMTTGEFFKRRLIRLHPLVIAGALLGALMFCLQGCVQWDGMTHVGTSLIMLALLLQMLMLPVPFGSAADVRGNGEMFSLNGPCWSLFFEYVGNILYALLLRRLSTRFLTVVTAALGIIFMGFAAFDVAETGMLGVGWRMGGWGFPGGRLRMLFPYAMGLLMARVFRPVRVRGIFWIASLALLAVFAAPMIESEGVVCLNALYDVLCIVFIFPVLVWLAASDSVTEGLSKRLCTFLGDISYPLYVLHYPLMYCFYAWMAQSGRTSFSTAWQPTLVVIGSSILLAYIVLKCYDLPLRRRLSGRFLRKKMRSRDS